MTLVKEIRIIDKQAYYVSVDYSNNKYGTIVSVNKRIVARLNRDVPATMIDGKITNITKENPEEKQTKEPEINKEIKSVETPVEKVETELEIKDEQIETDEKLDEVTETNEDENMVQDLEEIRRITREEIYNKEIENNNRIKQSALEHELNETKSRLDNMPEEFAKVLDIRMGGLSSKLDNIAAQKDTREAQEIINRMKNKEVVEHIHRESDNIKCTGNNCGHSMKKSNDGHTLKCTGVGCNKEMAIIDVDKMKKADSYCVDCHTPLISTEVDDCPTCHGKKGMYFNKK